WSVRRPPTRSWGRGRNWPTSSFSPTRRRSMPRPGSTISTRHGRWSSCRTIAPSCPSGRAASGSSSPVWRRRSATWRPRAVESAGGGEAGLMGLAVDPQFPRRPYIYAMHTHAEGTVITNRVIRLAFDGQALRFDKVIVANIPGGRIHDGGRIAFGPDGYLYI